MFYKEIYSTKSPEKWLCFLDWIFDEKKYSKWSKTEFAKLTRRIIESDFIEKDKFIYGGTTKVKRFIPYKKKQEFYVVFQQSDSVSRDLIRHIRNGFAHGNIKFKKNRSFVEILDYYTKSNKYTKAGEISAYLLIPVEFLFDIYNEYEKINRGLME